MRPTKRGFTFCFLLIVAGADSARAQSKPYSADDLAELLHAGVAAERIISMTKPACIDFRLTGPEVARLKIYGASDLLIEALRGVCYKEARAPAPRPTPQVVRPAPTTGKPVLIPPATRPTDKPTEVMPVMHTNPAKVRLSIVPSGVYESMYALWGTSASDVWAVGAAGTTLHYDGKTWSKIPSGVKPDPNGKTPDLQAVWGTSASNVWAVGWDGTILHFDGAHWLRVESPTSASLRDIWGTSPADIWSVGDNSTLLHFDGNIWSKVRDGGGSFLLGVWGSSPGNVWAVGTEQILHYSGGKWDAVADDMSSRNTVWGSSASNIWAGGDGGNAFHYDGGQWSRVKIETPANLERIWGTSAGDVWAIGKHYVSPNFEATVLHFDGSTWSNLDTGKAKYVYAVWGSSARNVWISAWPGGFLHYTAR
jgi:hypothetical protein